MLASYSSMFSSVLSYLVVDTGELMKTYGSVRSDFLPTWLHHIMALVSTLTCLHQSTALLFPILYFPTLVNLKYFFTSLTSPNFFLASSVLTLGGTITSSPFCQSIGVAIPLLSAVCKLSITLNTSDVFLPVLAGYDMVRRIFLDGSMMKTDRMVKAIPPVFLRASRSL
jgi:hypothetical protein